MKAFYIIAAAALIVFSGCSEKNGSGDTQGSDEKTYAAAMSDKLDEGSYAIDMVISGGGNEADIPCSMAASDGSGFVSMTTGGIYTEFYTVDDETYMLFPDISCYRVTGVEGAFGNGLFKLGEGDILYSSETADGVITEVYSSSGDEKETFTFVFGEEDGMLRSFRSETAGGEVTDITINSISYSGTEIALPDLTGWTDISDSEAIDEVTSIKFMLYSMGVTEETLEKAGYTYEELAKLSADELDGVLADMGADIYG